MISTAYQVTYSVNQAMDPQIRMLLESVFEASENGKLHGLKLDNIKLTSSTI